jgi:hypothetical protein
MSLVNIELVQDQVVQDQVVQDQVVQDQVVQDQVVQDQVVQDQVVQDQVVQDPYHSKLREFAKLVIPQLQLYDVNRFLYNMYLTAEECVQGNYHPRFLNDTDNYLKSKYPEIWNIMQSGYDGDTCLSLVYNPDDTIYELKRLMNEVRWDYDLILLMVDSFMARYTRNILRENK